MKKIILLLLFFLFLIANTTFAYSVNTHRIISEKATENSKLALDKGDYLKNLGFQDNIDEELLFKSVRNLIKDGSEDEDELPRVIHHYHNPLKSWASAGLNDITSGQSSLAWAQDSVNEYSWQAVRQYYLDALTGDTSFSREVDFAKTFEGLGHIIHLLQDTAQPAHVRNDAHVFDPYRVPLHLNGERIQRFETWSNDNLDMISNFASPPKLPTVDLSVSVIGYEPITQFFDTAPGTYDGTNPSTALNQGLAEYTNANFFSDDTIFTENYNTDHRHYFPFPRKQDTLQYDEPIGSGKHRTYFEKISNSNGEYIKHLATVERLYRFIFPGYFGAYNYYFLDEKCHEDYTEKLIPRAVGYSTELINYFFRGEIEVDLIDAESLTIKNSSSETMDGAFTLYYDAADGNRKLVSGGLWPFGSQQQPPYGPIGAGQTSVELTFTEPTDIAEGKKYILVFQGTLGSESNAVVGEVFSGAGCLDSAKFSIDSVVGKTVTVTPDENLCWSSFLWDWGDNQYNFYLGRTTPRTHTYERAGTYNIKLTAYDPDYNTGLTSGNVDVDTSILGDRVVPFNLVSNADCYNDLITQVPDWVDGWTDTAQYRCRYSIALPIWSYWFSRSRFIVRLSQLASHPAVISGKCFIYLTGSYLSYTSYDDDGGSKPLVTHISGSDMGLTTYESLSGGNTQGIASLVDNTVPMVDSVASVWDSSTANDPPDILPDPAGMADWDANFKWSGWICPRILDTPVNWRKVWLSPYHSKKELTKPVTVF